MCKCSIKHWQLTFSRNQCYTRWQSTLGAVGQKKQRCDIVSERWTKDFKNICFCFMFSHENGRDDHKGCSGSPWQRTWGRRDIWGKENVSEAEENSSVGNHPSTVATLKHLPVTFYPHESAFLSKGTWTAVLLSLLRKASVQDTHRIAWTSLNLPPFNPVGCFLWFSMILWGVWWKDTPKEWVQKVSSIDSPCFQSHAFEYLSLIGGTV